MVLSAALVAAVIVWKIIIPQTIAYANYQGYKHDNPIRRDIAEIKQMLQDKGTENGGTPDQEVPE
jgi:hypothetical protein